MKGWYGDRMAHSLASKGILTNIPENRDIYEQNILTNEKRKKIEKYVIEDIVPRYFRKATGVYINSVNTNDEVNSVHVDILNYPKESKEIDIFYTDDDFINALMVYADDYTMINYLNEEEEEQLYKTLKTKLKNMGWSDSEVEEEFNIGLMNTLEITTECEYDCIKNMLSEKILREKIIKIFNSGEQEIIERFMAGSDSYIIEENGYKLYIIERY